MLYTSICLQKNTKVLYLGTDLRCPYSNVSFATYTEVIVIKFLDPQNIRLGFGLTLIHAVVLTLFFF